MVILKVSATDCIGILQISEHFLVWKKISTLQSSYIIVSLFSSPRVLTARHGIEHGSPNLYVIQVLGRSGTLSCRCSQIFMWSGMTTVFIS